MLFQITGEPFRRSKTLFSMKTLAGPVTLATILEPAIPFPVSRTTSFSDTLNGLLSNGTTTSRSAPCSVPTTRKQALKHARAAGDFMIDLQSEEFVSL